MSKKCPYCGKSFQVLLKNKPSWERIVATFNDYNKALNYIKYYNERKGDFQEKAVG